MACEKGVPGVTGTLGKANSYFDPTQKGRGLHHHYVWLLIGSVQFCSLYYCIYDQNFALYHSERLELIRVLWTDRRSVLMIRVKDNSKSELVENRVGKSALYQ